jgi:hypothetical protein
MSTHPLLDEVELERRLFTLQEFQALHWLRHPRHIQLNLLP